MAWNREKERKAAKKMTVGSCIFGLLFSIFWCVMAAAMGGWFMLLFGIPFAIMMGYRLHLCLQMSKEESVQDQRRERDPWEQGNTRRSYTQPTYSQPQQSYTNPVSSGSSEGFCPYCGEEVKEEFAFCPKCGRRL